MLRTHTHTRQVVLNNNHEIHCKNVFQILHFYFDIHTEATMRHVNRKREITKNVDGEEDVEEEDMKDATRLLGLLHRYARENLLLANIYIKVT